MTKRQTNRYIVVIVCAIVSAVFGSLIVFGQGGTGREPANSNAAKKTPAKTTPKRTTRSGSRSQDEPEPSSTPANNPPSTVDPVAVEREYWETIRNSTNSQDFKDYLQSYPSGAYAAIARTKLRQLETPATVATPTSTDPSAAESNATLPDTLAWIKSALSYAVSVGSCDAGSYDHKANWFTKSVSVENGNLRFIQELNMPTGSEIHHSELSVRLNEIDPSSIRVDEFSTCGEYNYIVRFSTSDRRKSVLLTHRVVVSGTITTDDHGPNAEGFLTATRNPETAKGLANALKHAVILSGGKSL